MKTCVKQFNQWMSGLFVMLLVTILSVTNTQAQTILQQNFDAVWTTPSTLSPAWSTAANATGGVNALWAASSVTTAQSGWSSTSGAYSPAGANGSPRSARFHDYDCPSGGIGELYSPVMNFSSFPGEKAVSFYHINTSGTDVVRFAVSTDGGATWGPNLATIGVSSAWTQFVVPIGNTTSSNVMIKFRADGTFGSTDIGIDEVNVFVYNPANYDFTASALGGLWSSPASWAGGVVPPQGLANVIIPSGSTLTIDAAVLVSSLSISGVLQWNATANSLTSSGNVTINSGGRLHAHITSLATQPSITVGGNFTNNGYANLALGGSLTMNGTGSYTIGGSGTFEGDGTRGIIRTLSIGNSAGSYAINTTQNLTITANMGHTGGALNTNGKLRFDNTVNVFGRPINTQVANAVVTAMGSGYTSDPVIATSTSTQWTSGAAGSANSRYFNAGNIYLLTSGSTQGTVAPTHTSGTANNFLWLCSSGVLGTMYLGGQQHTAGTQYIYGDNLYLCLATGNGSASTGPTHTTGTATVGSTSFLYIGPAIKVSVNRDATTNTIRSLNIVNAGSGYASAPAITFSGGAGTGAAATVVVPQSIAGAAYGVVQKSGEATVTGGITINSDQGVSSLSANPQASSGVGSVYCTAGGANYTVAPQVGFSGPTALNLVTNGGSGFTTAPTITITGGTQPVGATVLATTDFTITVNQGKVVSVYLNASVTKTYITPPTLSFTGGGGTGATLAFPANCWPAATANIGSNRQITSFTVTNSGFGFVAPPSVAVGNASATATGGTYTTAASGFTSRIAAYYLATAFYTGANGAGTQLDDAYIPTSRKMHALWLNGNDNGAKLTGNLTLISGGTGTTVSLANSPIALRLVASNSTSTTQGQTGNVLDLGGNNLYCSWNGFAGATSTQGATNAHVKNGSITLTTRGGGTTGSTLNFPFLGTQSAGRFQVFTGSGTGGNNGADILTVKVSEMGAPGNSSSTGATGIAVGKRAYKVETATVGGGAGTAGTNPTVSANYNMTLSNSGPDSLYTTQDQTFLAESPTLNGAWTVRSLSVGASGPLANNGSLTSATTAPGPVTLANGNHYAFATLLPTITSVLPLSVCANSGNQTITGTNLSGVTAVTIGGVPVTSFTIVSSTQIDFVAGAQTSGVITIVKAGASINGTQTLNWTGGPAAVSISATTSTTILTGQTVSLSATGSGNAGAEIRWYGQATGGSSLGTGNTFTTPGVCSNRSFFAVEYDGSCEGPRTPIAVTVIRPSITVSKATFCGVGGADTLTVTSSSPSITYTWSNLNNAATFIDNINTGSQVVANVTATAEFRVVATNASCSDSAFISVGLYPLPSATVTTTASGVCPGTAATIGSGLSAGNFTASCITPVTSLSTPPANATTLILNGVAQTLPSGVSWSSSLDDGKFGPIPMGFNFNFFGNTQTTLNIGTNGVVNFGTYASFNGTQYIFTGGFPNSNNPANTIAVCARDLRFGTPSGYGSLRYWVEGIAPNRRFIVQYQNVPVWSNVVTTAGSESGFNNAEAVFYETLGTIDIRVISATNGSNTPQASASDQQNLNINKYIGLQDATKTVGATAPNCSTNAANFWNGVNSAITTPQAWRFSPPSNYNVSWFANGTQFANGSNLFSQNVAPQVTTLYSITYTNQTTGCTNEPRSAEVNMLVLSPNAPAGFNTLSSIDSTCTGDVFLLSTNYTGLTDGLTFQWQSSTDGGANWNDIPGATSITYTASQNVITTYRLKIVSCGGTPEYTTPKTVYFTYYITAVTSGLRCGTGTGTLIATANSNNIRWFDAATGGTNLGQVSSGATFTTPSVNATTVFWAEPRQGGCPGARVPDTLYVNPAPVLTISSNAATICGGDATSLVTVTAGVDNYDVLNWTPSTGVSGSVASGFTFNPTTTTTFTLNGSQSAGICTNFATLSVTVNPKPVIDSVQANNSTVCAGSPVILTAYSSFLDAGPQTAPTGYCAPTGLGGSTSSFFNSFSTTGGIQNITNTTDYSTNGYGDFTNLSVTANAGSTINFNTGLTGTTVGVAIWVDWNRNGTFDASERVYNTSGYVSTASGSFIVPLTASPGLTRMRIMMDYYTSNPANPCGINTLGRGEVEDYSFSVNNLSLINPSLNYTWNPGNSTGNPITGNPTVNTTYTVTATNVTTGCVGVVTGSKSIAVNQLPAAPEVSNSEQCGIGVPACFATGTTNGNYRWYLAATGGTALAGQTNNTLSGYSISTTTIFYVAITDGTCESNRVAVTATVNQPDAVTATVSNNDICANTSITLTATQTGTTNNYQYVWTASPASGSGITSSETGAVVSVTPSAAGTYTYTVTATDAVAKCVAISTIQVTVKPVPNIASIAATPAGVCAGNSSTLSASSIELGTGTIDVGVSTGTLTTTGSPYRSGAATTVRTQLIYTAAELTAAGLGAGNITSLAFSASNPSGTVSNFTISIGATSASSLSTTMETTSLTQVVNEASFTPVNGWNVHTFSTPFNWNGTSNILINVCQVNNISGTAPVNAYTSAGHNTQGTGSCTVATGTTSASKPIAQFTGVTPVSFNNIYNFSWSPGTATGNSVSVVPTSTTTYTVTVTNPITSCFKTNTVQVVVNTVPPAPAATGSEQCGAGIPSASVASTSGESQPIYKWYTTATGGTALQTGVSTTYTSSINATTTFYVSEITEAGCEGPRAAVLATVNQPDAIDITTTTTGNKICLNGSFNISTSYSPQLNTYDSYVLTASPAAGSGISGSVALNVNGYGTEAYTITPTAVGTYTYTITATESTLFGVCVTEKTVTISVNSNPVVDSIKVSATNICQGQTISANAYSSVSTSVPGSTTTLNYAAPGTTSPASSDNITLVQFGSISNSTTFVNTSGFDNYINTVPATTVNRGSSYTLTVNVSNGGGPEYAAVWFDWDRNGVYDASEFTNIPMSLAGNYVGSLNVTIPATASAGTIGMRVRSKYNAALTSADAYSAYTYGETEDYAVYVSGSTVTVVPVNPDLTYTWTPGNITGSTVSLTPASTGAYTCVASNPTTGCSSAPVSSSSITVNPLPVAVAVTNSTQCGLGIPTASVASGSATPSPVLNWYNSATDPSYTSAYNNGFNSSLNGASITGAAVLSGSQVVLTTNTTNQLGGLTIPAIGVNSHALNVSFNMTTTGGGGADGLSYSFGDDVSATATSPNAEVGTGSKLKIAFDNYGTGAGAAGIRVIYGSTINDPGTAPGTNGILAYSGNTSWIGGNNIPVVASINTSGKLSLTVNGTSIFSDIQLPSGYTSANNSTWQHVFKARTGGLAMVHALDSVNISYYNSGLINTGSTYPNTISQTTNFYVAEMSAAGCEGPRSQVVATVIQPDTLVASSNSPVCLGASVTLTSTVTSGANNNTYGLTWTNSQTGSGMSSATSGGSASFGTPASITITPTAAGTFTYTLNGVDGSCAASSTVSVVVNPNPIISGVTATPSSICAGSSVTLTGASVTSTNGSIVTGTGTSLSSSTSYPGIFENYWYQSWQQFIYRASELTALGLGAGNITSIKFNIGALPSPLISYTDYTVRIGNSTSNTATATFQTTGLSTVYGPGNIVPVVGLNTINFSSPYNWDGTSDLVVDIRQTGQYGNANSTTYYTSTGYNSVRYQYSSTDNSGFFTSNPSASTSTSRPNMTLNGVLSTNVANTYNWSWTGGATGNPATVNNITVSRDYFGTATNVTTGCSTTSSSAASVTVIPVTATATSSVTGFSCSGSAVTLTANPTGQGPFTYQWSRGGTNLGTAATQSVSPTATTTYTVTVKDACNNATTADVTVNVNELPTVSISETSPVAICAPNTQTLTAVPSVSTVTYQWMLNGTNITGATAGTYTAASSGTYTVKVTNTTTSCISNPSAGFALTVNPKPVAIIVTPSAPTMAVGSSASMTASGGTVTTNNVVALAENFDNNAPAWSISSSGVGANTQPWIYRTAPFTLSSGAIVFNAFSTPQGGKFPLVNADAGGSGSTTTTTLESPAFNTTNFTSATLTFEHLLRLQTGDVAKVQISTNGGTTWNDVASYSSSQGTTTSGAQVSTNASLTLNAAYLNQTNLKLRFNYSSPYGFYWLVDNVRISGTTVENYTYNWSPSGSLSASTGATVTATPASTTTYTVGVTSQNGCQQSKDVTVTVRPTAVISGTTFVCGTNNSVNLSIAVDGTGPWNGTLSNGQTFSGTSSPIIVSVSPTTTTTYTVATLTDASGTSIAADLTGSATVTVTVITAGITNQTGTTVLTCANQTINVTATGGTSYEWSGGLGNNAAAVISTPGTYTVTATGANGCTSTASITITDNFVLPTPGIVNNTGTTVITCFNSSISLTATGGVSYAWSNGLGNNATVTITEPGTYTVVVTGPNNCSASTSITLTTSNIILPNFVQHPARTKQKVTLNLPPAPYSVTVGTGTITYQWYRNTVDSNIGGTLIAGATTATYQPPSNAISTYHYYCVITNEYGCSRTSNPSGAVVVCGP